MTGNTVMTNGSYTSGLVVYYPVPNDAITVTNNIISGHVYPIEINVISGHLDLPIVGIHSNITEGDDYNALYVHGTLTEDNNFFPTNNLTYKVSSLTVNAGANLTVAAGRSSREHPDDQWHSGCGRDRG